MSTTRTAFLSLLLCRTLLLLHSCSSALLLFSSSGYSCSNKWHSTGQLTPLLGSECHARVASLFLSISLVSSRCPSPTSTTSSFRSSALGLIKNTLALLTARLHTHSLLCWLLCAQSNLLRRASHSATPPKHSHPSRVESITQCTGSHRCMCIYMYGDRGIVIGSGRPSSEWGDKGGWNTRSGWGGGADDDDQPGERNTIPKTKEKSSITIEIPQRNVYSGQSQ